MSTWNKIFGPTVWGAKSSNQMRLFKTIRQSPYLIGAALSYAARSDGPSVFEGSRFIVSDVPAAAQDAPSSWYRRTSGYLDDLIEAYYFG